MKHSCRDASVEDNALLTATKIRHRVSTIYAGNDVPRKEWSVFLQTYETLGQNECECLPVSNGRGINSQSSKSPDDNGPWIYCARRADKKSYSTANDAEAMTSDESDLDQNLQPESRPVRDIAAHTDVLPEV